MASRPLLTVSVTTVPVAKLALPVVPTLTVSPAGLDDTHSPERPVAVTVSWAVDVVPPPQTLATPPPPQVWGAVHVPQVSVPPQPSAMLPQFFPCAAQVVGVQLAAGFTVKTADAVPLLEAEMVTRFVAVTAEVLTVKLALVWPAGTRTLPGTVATAELLERNTPTPPGGAAMLSVTVPVEALPPVTELGFSDSPDTPTLAAVPHWPATPPPPQVSPKSQPHVMVPPQPSESTPHGPPCTVPPRTWRQVLGVHPAVTVSGTVTGA
jgi:hypothetical protein